MSQKQTVIVTGLKMSKGEFTPENGMNKGVPQPYDNLNIYASVPFPEGDMESLGAKEQQFKLKGSGNFYRFKDVQLPAECELEFEFDFTKTPPRPVLKDINFL
ncbi:MULTISPECIES: hypothetical protein [Acinetobacter calcoaceticus/baumannii complex]|uniref:Single-stranded DNA-binding protein n=6 Tax=Acinetobacter baumannii TaxID=470 RepID=A0AAV3JW61_ACIBA|nr:MULTISPECIES: hypothetical protein [Acinetobacter calcoaceticus/baumannii complex]ATP87134.1 hypothetical protein A388_01923 [Acinetobacter baumannii]ATP87144.1 hypothetical protein A388_01933 [Acinetobacter baumannii]EHU2885078.1 hypothetical protein [Acinetobacter baumannii]EHU3108127.1 hypothetical protein [Acinetobacter baumannii]EHU3333210.1 hypothetical protein [Acinetobacter baumannii]